MAKQFLKECKETRDAFVKVAGTYNISDNLELRTEIDSLLIMYDQLCERVRLVNADTGENNALLPDVSTSTDNEEPIDIYATEGMKVKYTGRGGYDHHKEHANKHLKVDEIYTIDHTVVGGWHTNVYLKEVPNEAFNSVHFVNAE